MNATACRIDPYTVLRLTGKRYGVTVYDIKSKRRTANLALARHVAAWLLRRHSGLSYQEIGSHLQRNYTTAMHGEKRIERLIGADASVRAAFDSIVVAGEGEGEEHGSGI